jgi:hypothetical protein
VSNTTGGGDTTAPTVLITSPAQSSTVSSTTVITASSSDNVAVAGVTFYVNDVALGVEDTTAPYSVSWNTASSTNGTYTIKALSRDLAGNTASSTITVTVSNATTTTPVNLISNASLQVAGTNGLPVDWFRGLWGTNDAVLNYTASTTEGATEVSIAITNYTDGDAKWFFKDVFITPLTPYTYSEYYKSTVPTTLTVRYTMTTGAFVYVDIPQTAPASPAWTDYVTTITPPVGAVSMTVFHKLDKVGTLSLDSFSLVRTGPDVDPGLFAQGMVSLTLDDAWLSQYQNAVPVLNNAGLKATFGVISLETLEGLPDNRINNASLEVVDASTTLPVDWFYGSYGTNDATSTFPVAGYDGVNAAKVQITNYTDGDAKWFFKDGTVIQNNDYTYKENYLSDATTTLTVRYTYADNSTAMLDIGTVGPAPSWAQFVKTFTIPANVVSLTIFHRLASVGSLTIDNAELKRVQIYMDPTMIQALQAAGHEVSSHTRTHASLSTVATSASD